MIGTLVSLTIRGLLNRRRTLLLALVGILLIVVGALSRLADPTADEALTFSGRLLADFGIGVVLPLVAVVIGTAAIGSELEDGTLVYLLAKPIPRWLLAVVKLLAAWVTVVALVGPALAVGALVAGGDGQLALAGVAATTIGALEYVAIFLALSLVTGRALVIGLAYVVVWEGVIAGLFAGTRVMSVRQHALAIGDAVRGDGIIPSTLDALPALGVALLVTVLAAAIAIRNLERVELRGETG